MKMNIVQEINKKGADSAKLAGAVMNSPDLIGELIEGVTAPKGTARYGCEKMLRRISEDRPDLLYPFFDVFVGLLDSSNSFIKWGAVLIVAHLTKVDSDKRFEDIFQRYYAPITGPTMITAANIIRGSIDIVLAKPELAGRISHEILKVEKAIYRRNDSPSPECRNVAIGQAIDAFNQIYDKIDRKEPVIKFVKRQLKNSRKAVIKKAKSFLAAHVK